MTLTIPRAAMPVVQVLRRDVKKPETLPHVTKDKRFLRWGGVCVMGLHYKSSDNTPVLRKDFAGGICSQRAVDYMYWWWDSQTDARAAIDAVWPEK